MHFIVIIRAFLRGTGLLDAASGGGEVEVLIRPSVRIILSRLAVVAGVLSLVAVSIAVRLFVHID